MALSPTDCHRAHGPRSTAAHLLAHVHPRPRFSHRQYTLRRLHRQSKLHPCLLLIAFRSAPTSDPIVFLSRCATGKSHQEAPPFRHQACRALELLLRGRSLPRSAVCGPLQAGAHHCIEHSRCAMTCLQEPRLCAVLCVVSRARLRRAAPCAKGLDRSCSAPRLAASTLRPHVLPLLALGLLPHSAPLSPVSCRLEPPSRLHAAKNLRRTELHPRVEPLRHEEGLKPTNAIRFPCHGRPIADSLLHPPSGPDSTSTSFTPAHCSSPARQTPPSTAPPVDRCRASSAAQPSPCSVFFDEFPPSPSPKIKARASGMHLGDFPHPHSPPVARNWPAPPPHAMG
jgi:hypothetical protein